jgi:hypothetical protein
MAKSGAPDVQRASMADRSVSQALRDYMTRTFGVVAAEVQKIRHDPVELFTRAVQPVLWLVLFGEVMARVRGVAPENLPISTFFPPASWRKAPCSSSSFTGFRRSGPRPRHPAALPRQPGTALGAGDRQSAFRRRARAGAGRHRLPAGADARGRDQRWRWLSSLHTPHRAKPNLVLSEEGTTGITANILSLQSESWG